MTFSNPAFYLFFLPLSLLGFQVFGRFGRRGAIGFLALASFVFYAQWSKRYLVLLIASILFNYMVSRLIARFAGRERLQSAWLWFGIAGDLLAIGYFKYLFPVLGFFTEHGLGHRDWGSIILPLGISFFTFTQIAYLVDLKQGAAKPESLLNYSLFVTFFPHLIAGPILHHKEMMPQFKQQGRYQLNHDDVALGLTWFIMGMFKKVVIADNIAPIASGFYTDPHGAGALQAWLGTLAYTLQLYFDFSGYSDMAIGLARMFSIRFPYNFNSPYKASNIIDFWQRWHMTLTSYIMDYVYGPLQLRTSKSRLAKGKKISKRATATLEGFLQMVAMPTLVTMVIVGVWHGAGKQFLVFGLVHGLFLVINHAWRIFVPHDSRLQKPLVRPLTIGMTFSCVVIADVFFRADSLRMAFTVLVDMMGRHGLGHRWHLHEVIALGALFAIVWLLPNTQEILGEARKEDQPNWSIFSTVQWQPTLPWWVATTVACAVSICYSTANTTFLYFQF